MGFARPVLVLLTATLSVFACSTQEAAGPDEDATPPLPAEDGSSAACTDLGGTCVTFQVSCPVAQQNTALCGDSTMICCLPEGGAIIVQPEAGPGPEAGPHSEAGPDAAPHPEAGPEAAPEAAPETGPVEASPEAAGD